MGYRSNPFSGGQGVYIRNVARALADRGHLVDVISGEPYPLLPNHPGIALIKLPGLNLFDKTDRLRALRKQDLTDPLALFEWFSVNSGGFPEPYTFAQRLYRYLQPRRHHYDVIHDNQTLGWGLLKLQKQGFPIITTVHHPITYDRDIALAHAPGPGLRLLIRRWHYFLRMQTRVAQKLKHIVTVSESSRQDIATAFAVPQNRIHLVPNGIDTHFYKPSQTSRSAGSPQLISTASADQPLKGTVNLMQAFAQVRQQFPDAQLTLIGKPKPDGPTAAAIHELDLAAHIRFVHGISDAEVVDLYHQSDLAVVPSEYEGFGLPAAEAMACGVAVVSTDGGALPEVVGQAGVVVPKANSNALAEGITMLLNDPVRRTELAAAGRRRVEQNFSAKVVGENLVTLYKELLL